MLLTLIAPNLSSFSGRRRRRQPRGQLMLLPSFVVAAAVQSPTLLIHRLCELLIDGQRRRRQGEKNTYECPLLVTTRGKSRLIDFVNR